MATYLPEIPRYYTLAWEIRRFISEYRIYT